jgi:hypothetical protein
MKAVIFADTLAEPLVHELKIHLRVKSLTASYKELVGVVADQEEMAQA